MNKRGPAFLPHLTRLGAVNTVTAIAHEALSNRELAVAAAARKDVGAPSVAEAAAGSVVSSAVAASAGVIAGMRLEAVDRKNPQMICVATIAAVNPNRMDCFKIHFDGWTDRYDYWAPPDADDLHPVGWCAATGKTLQKPKNHPGPFSWPAYLLESGLQPVPPSCLSAGCNVIVNGLPLGEPAPQSMHTALSPTMRWLELALDIFETHFHSVEATRKIVRDMQALGQQLRLACAIQTIGETGDAPMDVDQRCSLPGGIERQISSSAENMARRRERIAGLLASLSSMLQTDSVISAFEFQSSGLAEDLLAFFTEVESIPEIDTRADLAVS